MMKPGTRAFIVDDDKSFGKSLTRLLSAQGFVAEHFESAKAFLDSVPSGQKGIVVIDIVMPQCDGFELMEKMQDLGYDMPVILITGNAEAGTRDAAIQKGAAGFLHKPFAERSLLALIEGCEHGVK